MTEMHYDPRVSAMVHVPCSDTMQLTHGNRPHADGYMQQCWACPGCGVQLWHGTDAAGRTHIEEDTHAC